MGVSYESKVRSVYVLQAVYIYGAENVSSCKVGILCSDRGGGYMSKDFNAFLADCGIKHQYTVPYTPQQNGVAERKNRSLMEMARCMVKSQALPHTFWLEAIMCATYVLNRCPTKALKFITPYESWHGLCEPSVAHLRVFGCLAYALVPEQHRKKLVGMTRLSNAFLLSTVQKVKAIVCIIRSLNISWSAEMLFLLRMQFSLCFYVAETYMLAHMM